MPTYDYACDTCGHRFDVFQSIKDEPLKNCVNCGSSVRRVIGSGGGIIFKGSGFYVNDYKNGNGKGKSETKPEAKTESPACASCPSAGACSVQD